MRVDARGKVVRTGERAKTRAVDEYGEASAVGSHFKADACAAVPFGDAASPVVLGSLVLDVLKSDTPVARGERILYREPGGMAEYRVISSRSRGGSGDWVAAVLMERGAFIPDPSHGLHPERVHEVGTGEQGEADGEVSEVMTLSALYGYCAVDGADFSDEVLLDQAEMHRELHP